jgi:hypothetical protein
VEYVEDDGPALASASGANLVRGIDEAANASAVVPAAEPTVLRNSLRVGFMV